MIDYQFVRVTFASIAVSTPRLMDKKLKCGKYQIMTEIKNAATIVLLREEADESFVLMGERRSSASFMPGKYVFPGGGWERFDRDIPFAKPMSHQQKRLLKLQTDFIDSPSLGITAIRELWEETGLRLSSNGVFMDYPECWKEFFLDSQGPNLSNLKFFFRAVTPPGRSRRFDARFFFCNAKYIFDDLDNFAKASGELINLKWVTMSQAKSLEVPKITQIVIEHLNTVTRFSSVRDPIPFYSGGRDGLDKRFLDV